MNMGSTFPGLKDVSSGIDLSAVVRDFGIGLVKSPASVMRGQIL